MALKACTNNNFVSIKEISEEIAHVDKDDPAANVVVSIKDSEVDEKADCNTTTSVSEHAESSIIVKRADACYTPTQNSEQSKLFSLYIKSKDSIHRFRVINNVPDGNCLFRAVSQSLHQSEEHYDRIRCEIVDYITSPEKWPEYYPHVKGQYENILVKDENSNNYWSLIKSRPRFRKSNKPSSPTGNNQTPEEKQFEVTAAESENFKRIYRKYMTRDKCFGSMQELIAAADSNTFNVVVVRELSPGHYNILNFLEKGHIETHYFLFTGMADDGHFELLVPELTEDDNAIAGTSLLRNGDYKEITYNKKEHWALLTKIKWKYKTSDYNDTSSFPETASIDSSQHQNEDNCSDGKMFCTDNRSGWKCETEEYAALDGRLSVDHLDEKWKPISAQLPKKRLSIVSVHPRPSGTFMGAGDVEVEETVVPLQMRNIIHSEPLSMRRRCMHFFSRPLRVSRNCVLCICCPYLFTKGILTRNHSANSCH